MELLYKLNIPVFESIIRDDWKHNIVWGTKFNPPPVIPVENVIKEEFLKFNGIHWRTIVRFPLDSNCVPSYIHSDNCVDSIDKNLENPKIILFAINYLITGTGRMDYYLPSQLNSEPFFDPLEVDPYQQKNWTTEQKPYKSYEMIPGAYLVNVTIPHRAIAYSERLVCSMRPDITAGEHNAYWQTKSWEDIVKMFDNYIIK